ncbi:hypothetical protein DID77_00395 [Candidatus Marinamargulisbacteria bacterium SCGC AG-439-L15]|nr:hypothetical protein DID77_00395 [Candidatus Marinamargulisbacteria bacterium SCGC AG-439-L15]
MKKKYIPERSLFKSFSYALRGIGFSFFSQRNMQIHSLAACSTIGLGWYFKLQLIEWTLIVISIFGVLISEMINTSIELSVDLTTRKRKIRAMLAKDVAAGTVLLAALNAVIIGSLIFFPRFVTLCQGGS